MISRRLVTCSLCQSYYADPRQIPCSHSFCFDCILGRFSEETFTLVCPTCSRLYQYKSLEEFQKSCMRDGFLATTVAQYKRNQSRLSAIPSPLSSRPPSSISQRSVFSSSTPIPRKPTQESDANICDHSSSNSPTPSTPIPRRPSSVLPPPPVSKALIAKCQSCCVKGELVVCKHCENVICMKCSTEHQRTVNVDVKREWDLCKAQFEGMSDQSTQYDTNEDTAINKARTLQTFISQQCDNLIKKVEYQKNTYTDIIAKNLHIQKQCSVQDQIAEEYESIDKRITDLVKSNDMNAEKINDFLFEISHLEGRLDILNRTIDSKESKFPLLTFPEQIDIPSLFGTLDFTTTNIDSDVIDPYSSSLTNGHSDAQVKSEDEEFIPVDSTSTNLQENFLSNSTEHRLSPRSLSSILNVPKKKLLWQIDYFSVPYYVRIYESQLFVCDKYGSLAIYKLNRSYDVRQRPALLREFKLFKDNPNSTTIDDEQTIIDSFAVYKLWIIVFKRKKTELHGTIYLFTHDGKLVSNGKCPHNYPSRELTMDIEKNILWSLDQKQLCLFYYDLPDTKPNNPEEYFQNRCSHVQFSKPFAPIHISVNRNVLAVLDKNRQAVHVYDKNTRQELYEHVNVYGTSTHFCWDMALFSDNSLLIKLDEMSTLKTGPSKHIYLQLDTTRNHNIVGTIEEIDAYGMMINLTDEILIGVRKNTKGIIKCYV